MTIVYIGHEQHNTRSNIQNRNYHITSSFLLYHISIFHHMPQKMNSLLWSTLLSHFGEPIGQGWLCWNDNSLEIQNYKNILSSILPITFYTFHALSLLQVFTFKLTNLTYPRYPNANRFPSRRGAPFCRFEGKLPASQVQCLCLAGSYRLTQNNEHQIPEKACFALPSGIVEILSVPMRNQPVKKLMAKIHWSP